jgi:glycosyltransferase involved in cell wall biosynthesis
MNRKRILIIENSTHITGALKAVVHTAIDLQAHFDFVFVLPKDSKGVSWVRTMGFKTIYELPMRELSRNFFPLVTYLPLLLVNGVRLWRIIIAEKIDLIHNNDLYNLLPVIATRWGRKVPYVCHIRFLPNKFPKLLFSFWLTMHLRYSQKIICVSKHLVSMLPLHSKITVIYDGLPRQESYAEKLVTENRIMYLGNIIKGKGQEYAVEAFAKIATRYPNWKIRFVGGDMGLKKNALFKQQLMAICDERHLVHQVEWKGFTDNVEVEYKTATIALNFSESESFSLTCLEALFFGCPIVATRSGGPAEIIDDQETGYLVPLGNINRMAEAMEDLMANEEKRIAFAKAGRDKVRARFSKENTSHQLERLYNELWH